MYLSFLSSFLSLISMRLQALLDHFGYEVAFLKDWHMETWFNQRKFDSWFATLRNNRRLKAIMPLLHEISSDDSDDDGGDPGNLPPPTSSGGNGNAPEAFQEGSGDPSPSEEDGEVPGPSDSVEESHGNEASQLGDKAITVNTLIQKLGPEKFFINPHRVVFEDENGITYGSFDRKFPFISYYQIVPLNPLVFVDNVHHSDFERLEMDDPRVEDINTIIAVSARGIMDEGIHKRLELYEEQIDDHLCPSIYKFIVGKVAGFTSGRGRFMHLLRPMMALNPQVSYNDKGWVGKREISLRNKCGKLSPRTRCLKFQKQIVTLPKLTKAQAYGVLFSLHERIEYKKFPKKLLKFYGLN